MLIVDNIDTDTYVMDDVNTIYLVKGNARRIILPKYLRTVISNALYDIEGLEKYILLEFILHLRCQLMHLIHLQN